MSILDATAARALRDAGARASVVAVSLALFELGVRTAASSARLPDVETAALDVAAHVGRVASIVPAMAIADLAASAVASTRFGAKIARAGFCSVALLAAPRRALRLVGVTLLALVLFAQTLGRQSQLPWHLGALYAVPSTAAFACGELAWSWWRKESLGDRVHPVGFAILVFALGLFAALVPTYVDAGLAGAAIAAALILAATRAFTRFAPLRAPFVLAAWVGLAGLVGLDALRPELRRFDGVHTPFSTLGRTLLAWATDLDGDGASGLFGLDCDDTDPTRGPFLTDIPDDGVDQNCRGGDGSLARAQARFLPGGAHAPMAAHAATAEGRPVFVITIDAWRADAFDDATFPETRAWASRCFEFTNARATAPATALSLLSLHAGVFARHVIMDDADDWFIDLADPSRGHNSSPPTLSASLAIERGYWTAVVFPPFHASNFSFLTGYVAGGSSRIPDTGAHFPPAATMLDAARDEMRRAAPNRPLHLRVHLMDLHTPYAGGSGREGYERTARSVDAPLAAFLRELPDDAVVVVTADHGEAFGEHGYTQHGHTLFDEELRVPLLVCAPSAELGVPRVVEAPVSLTDIMPTLLDLVGGAARYPRHGESLVPLLKGGERRKSWVFAENPLREQQAVVDGCDKWIEDAQAGWAALFDVCRDPEERRDIARAQPERAERMRRLLAQVVDDDLDAIRSWRVGRQTVAR